MSGGLKSNIGKTDAVAYGCRHDGGQLEFIGSQPRQRTCDLQVVGSSPGWASLRSGRGQPVFLCRQTV